MKSVFDDELKHHGILGQKWGVRRFQNEDGSLKPAGERRYSVNNSHSNTQSNGSGAVKPNGARNPKYVLGSSAAKKRGSGLGTGPVGDRGEFVGGGAGHTFANSGGGGKASETGGVGRNREPQPIGSPEWWKWYENTPDREIAEKHYNMVIAKESRDRKRQKRGVEAQRKTAHKQEMSKDFVDRKKLVNRAAKTVKKAANSVVSAVSGAANAGKSFIINLLGKKG